VDLALRLADHRPQPVSQREALVRRDRQPPGRAQPSPPKGGEGAQAACPPHSLTANAASPRMRTSPCCAW
jgi:hypothetical protein